MSAFDRILSSDPIDRLAAIVTSCRLSHAQPEPLQMPAEIPAAHCKRVARLIARHYGGTWQEIADLLARGWGHSDWEAMRRAQRD